MTEQLGAQPEPSQAEMESHWVQSEEEVQERQWERQFWQFTPPGQKYPDSILQEELQPSPFAVLLSSQV